MPKVGKKGYICALDIGSSKVVCLIAQSVPVEGQIDVLGVGYQQAQGIKKGMITDVETAAQCIQSAVLKAEKEAQLHVSSVIVNVSSSKLVSKIIQSEIEIEDDHPVTSSDVKRLVDQTLKQVDLADQEIVLQVPLYYIVDDQEGIEDPRGLYGKILGVKLHFICLPVSHMKNLETVLNKCRLGIDYKVATPYASALACLTEEERKVGAALIDIGADTTSIALYLNDALSAVATLPLGGNLITKDIAQGLMTSFTEAERLKTLEGAAFSSPRDENETLNIRVVGESQDNAFYPSTKAYLNDIIESRVDEMLETIQMYLSSVSQYHIAAQHVVLTGGASQLEGLREKTASALQAHVQLSRPIHVRGLPSGWNEPAFATSVGLLRYALNKQAKKTIYKKSELKVPHGVFGRIAQWLIQNF